MCGGYMSEFRELFINKMVDRVVYTNMNFGEKL